MWSNVLHHVITNRKLLKDDGFLFYRQNLKDVYDYRQQFPGIFSK